MEPSFWLKLALSFAVGSTWVTLSTLFAERFGSKLGGLIGGLPSTAVISLSFIGYTQSPFIAAQAAALIPIVQGINSVFIIVYLLMIQHSLFVSLFGGLIAWFSLAGLLMLYPLQSVWVSVAGWLGLGLGSIWFVEKRLAIPSYSRIRLRYTLRQVGLRALFGGSVIAFAVLSGKLGGPLYGGIFATFPAMFISTLIVTYYSGGADFSSGVAKSLMVSGAINVPLYALAVRFLYPQWGLIAGTLAAFSFSLVSGYWTYRFMQVKLT
jgi:hypothetical protein